jgi:ribonuclease HII
MNGRFAFDLELAGRGLVAGADEAGRGSLAGPLLAAAVLFDYSHWTEEDFAALEALDDSKRHTRERREELFALVVTHARQVAVVSYSSASIDERGLHRCNLSALERALSRLRPAPEVALVDGFALKECPLPHRGLIGGDGKSAAVAAASIVAKVVRDRLMVTMHGRWPSWGFAENVGYATPGHHAAILKHGLTDLHRRSFQSVAYQQLELGLLSPEELEEKLDEACEREVTDVSPASETIGEETPAALVQGRAAASR